MTHTLDRARALSAQLAQALESASPRPTTPLRPTPDDVRAARLSAGLTQEAAAALVHASRRGWQDWESGARTIPSAEWELYLLYAGQHPGARIVRR